MIKAIDVSSWQENIDWKKVKADGVKLAVLREGYRKTIDKYFLQNAKGCKENGIAVQIYHFIYWDGATIKENAVSTVNNMKQAGLDIKKTYVWVDLEYDSWTKAGETVSKSRCSAIIKEYIKYLKELGCERIGIYYNLDYGQNYLDMECLGYPCWLAQYSDSYSTKYKPVLWQYGSSGKVAGINGNCDMDWVIDESIMSEDTHVEKTEVQTMGYDRNKVLDVARGWLGCNEVDGSFKKILDCYNNYQPWNKPNKWGAVARHYAIQYYDEWCATFASACFIKAGMPEICPLEVSCYYEIVNAQKMGCWVEDEHKTPEVGWLIIYTWSGNQSQSDHVGIIEKVSGSTLTVIEGNKSEVVARRTINVGNVLIRGYVAIPYGQSYTPSSTPSTPQSSGGHDVQWTGYICKQTTPKIESRADASNMKTVTSADVNDKVGVCYSENGYFLVKFDKSGTYGFVPVNCVQDKKVETKPVTPSKDISHATSKSKFTISGTGTPSQKELRVGKVTADSLNIRVWAGTENAKCKSRGALGYGNMISVCDSILDNAGDTWYYVFIGDAKIFAFVHSGWVELQ